MEGLDEPCRLANRVDLAVALRRRVNGKILFFA